MMASLPQRVKDVAGQFDQRFGEYLTPGGDVPQELVEAIRYSALAPGKRIRPYLVVRCCELVGGRVADYWPVAAAVECVHAFSLIHDDLPAMDDDNLRRGRPTCHKKFDEATAVLAGDALVVLAFELLTRHVKDQVLAARMVLELAVGTGWAGMIGGQTADILGQSKPPALELASYIHKRKTASLFETSCRLGALVGGGSADSVAVCGRFGQSLGRAFQIADDLLDVTSTARELGKEVGKDAAANKQTFPQCVGIERSRTAAMEQAKAATAELDIFGPEADDLRALARYVVDRNY
ncbi:MAG: polyprenyl synthetase family protein [Phycisphaerales bacterium]|nr:MAG: polyprenyl synthetase family protein [Phycisphaerales bacterium]